MYLRFYKFFEEHTNLTRFSLIFREDSSLSFTFCLYKFFLVKLHVLSSPHFQLIFKVFYLPACRIFILYLFLALVNWVVSGDDWSPIISFSWRRWVEWLLVMDFVFSILFCNFLKVSSPVMSSSWVSNCFENL